MRRAVLVPFILAAVVSVARAEEEITSEGWGGFIAWQEWAEWGMDGGVEEQPAYIVPAEYLDYGTKLLECTNIHLSTQAEASIRISLLKLDWNTGERVPRWPGGPPATIPVSLHTNLEISADGVWGWEDADEQVDATFDFDDGQFAYYSVNVNRDEDLGAGWRGVVSEAIFGRMVTPWDAGPLIIVHQWIAPEWGNEFPEPDWRIDTWGDFTASVTISIEPNEPPVAVATADPVEVEPGEPVTFSGAQSTDPNDDPLTYSWMFSDGTYAQGVEVQHPFAEPGMHWAELMVEDGRFATDFAVVDVLVKSANEPPVAALSVEPNPAVVGQEVTFHTTGTGDPDEETLTYTLTFGDGTPSVTGKLFPPYPDLAVKHTYTEPGRYTARLTVSDGQADPVSVSCVVAVVGVSFSKDPIIVEVNAAEPTTATIKPGDLYGDISFSVADAAIASVSPQVAEGAVQEVVVKGLKVGTTTLEARFNDVICGQATIEVVPPALVVTARPSGAPAGHQEKGIGAGGIPTPAHQALVEVKVGSDGIHTVSLSLEGGEGAPTTYDVPILGRISFGGRVRAKLSIGGKEFTAGSTGQPISVQTDASGVVRGVLTSSNRLEVCRIVASVTLPGRPKVTVREDVPFEAGEGSIEFSQDVLPPHEVVGITVKLAHHTQPMQDHELVIWAKKVVVDDEEIFFDPDHPQRLEQYVLLSTGKGWGTWHRDPRLDKTDALGETKARAKNVSKGELERVTIAVQDMSLRK